MKGSVLIPFFYFYLSRFTSSTYKGSYILSIVYYCILCHRLDNHLDSIFFSESSICSIGMYPHFFSFFFPVFCFFSFFFFLPVSYCVHYYSFYCRLKSGNLIPPGLFILFIIAWLFKVFYISQQVV